MESDDDEHVLFNAQVLYREWGRRFTVLHQFIKGIYYYKESTKYGDENYLVTLIGLSEALKKSGQFKEASDVAEKCMEKNPTHLGANWTRMEALFDTAEFCHTLVYAYQGMKLRPRFRFAVLASNETIEDCVGANVPPTMLRHIQPWIAKLNHHRERMLQRLKDKENEFQGIDEEQTRFKVSDPKAKLRKYLKSHDKVMASMYIGASCHDKQFLTDLLLRPALSSANKAGSESLVKCISNLLAHCQSQQESLRTRRPLYSVHARLNAAKTTTRKFILYQEFQHRRCLARQTAVYLLKQLHAIRLRRDYQTFFKMVELVKDSLEFYGHRLLPEYQKYLEVLYRMVSRVYIDPRNLHRFCNEPEEVQAGRLRRLLGLRNPRLPRDSDLAWIHSSDVKRSLNTCRQRLALTKNSLEILWIFHELCKLFLEIKRYDLARFYAKKTRDLSLESGYDDWAVNANHVLVRIELIQFNRNEAREAAAAALVSANRLSVNFLVDFYERTIAFIDNVDFGRPSDDDSILARQRMIIQIMPPMLKPKMDQLLNSMEAVTASRRLSIMPGCKSKDTPGQGMRKTITPKMPQHYEKGIRDNLLKKFAPSKKVLGLPSLDEFS